MNKIKITFGIMSNKYQIEAYNKLDAYAAMAIFFGRDLPYVVLFEPYNKDNWIGDYEKFLELFGKTRKIIPEIQRKIRFNTQ